MDERQKSKIISFLNDKTMSEAVYELLLEVFLKPPKDRDVQNLAASMIAIERLNEGFKELNRIKNEQKEEGKRTLQVGL